MGGIGALMRAPCLGGKLGGIICAHVRELLVMAKRQDSESDGQKRREREEERVRATSNCVTA